MIYQPLQLGQPGQPKCPDQYTNESSRLTPGAKRIILQTSKQAVYVQFGVFVGGVRGSDFGSIVWQAEEVYLPIIGSLARDFDAVRVRNYTPGQEAQVLLNFS